MVCHYLCLAKDVDKLENGFGGKGNWTVLKCFYEKHSPDCNGDCCEDCQYGEFYIDANPQIGILEIATKDSDYADDLVSAFRETMEGNDY